MSVEQTERLDDHTDEPSAAGKVNGIGAALRLASEMGELLRCELLLAREEVSGGARGLRLGVLLVATATLFICSSVPLLMVGAALAMAHVFSWPAWSAFVLVGTVGMLAGGVFIVIGHAKCRTNLVVPRRSLQALRRTGRLLREAVR
jgi:hypothetical protein